MDSSGYYDDFAAFYDAAYGQQAGVVEDDVQFYLELAREADGPLLEVGCGTGRIYLELLRADIDADGIDLSSGMLEVLRENAADEGLEPNVREADVTSFRSDREYALVIVPFRAFLHLTTVDDQLAALERIHDVLAPGGRLALNVFTPNFDVICEAYGEPEETTVEVDGETCTYRTVTELADEVEQLARIRSEVLTSDGERLFEREAPIALVSKREFELLFRQSPFSSWDVYGGFEYDPLEDSSQEMVWIADR
ncbi:class I SAM-dependent methyltransferase [Natronococcus pandeyae]|uniref:Class I SAM-dependent methyltransferase n=1 Tax=Natronococcus pandeyae TaxID=2055836 RepID=A0A8J8Q2E7_9EURY|nr:class I SAM-dependent methyltransferase [Natronococcus pandeyae]TYL39161.1 class I SAM-dependent methyltransferase [Natronococcus pandeyae]